MPNEAWRGAMSTEMVSFRTKAGRCTLSGGKLVLSREGWRGKLSALVFGTSMVRARVVYALIAALMLANGLVLLGSPGDRSAGIVFCVLAAYLLYVGVLGNRDVTADMEIALDSVRRVTARAPRPPLTRGYFEVHYEVGGVPRRRFIMLPGVFSGGAAEFEKASEVFRQLGLLK